MAETFHTWPTGAPEDARRALPVFSILPNWAGGVTERLEWLTDVMSSEESVEQRRSIRRYPRRSFEAQFLRHGAARSRIDNFLSGVGKSLCLVPLWHEQFRPLTQVEDGIVQFPTDSLAFREFRQDDLVLVTNKAHERYAVLTVMDVDLPNDTITLAGFERDEVWPMGSRIIPLRRARILDTVSIANRTSHVGMLPIRFSLADADPNFTPSFGSCAPIWSFRPNRFNDVAVTFARDDYVMDYGTGVIDVTDLSGRSIINTAFQIQVKGREFISKFRSFLYAARGKAIRFYVPSYTADLHPIEDFSGNTIDCEATGFFDYHTIPQDARRVIALVFADGRPAIYRRIQSVAPLTDGDGMVVAERFTLDQGLPPISAFELARIQFMVPSRFDQDAIEIFHPVDDSRVIQSSVVFKSSTLEEMPDMDCWVTSKPYPIVEVEAMTMGFMFGNGGSRLVPSSMDSMETAFGFGNGTLRDLLSAIVLAPERMTTTFMFGNGTLVQTFFLKEIEDQAPDTMTVAFMFGNGMLEALLIQYDDWPEESMAAAFTFTDGGTLT